MLDFMFQNPSIYRRRHAIKPDEADFLKNNQPSLIGNWPNQELSQTTPYAAQEIEVAILHSPTPNDHSTHPTIPSPPFTNRVAKDSRDNDGSVAFCRPNEQYPVFPKGKKSQNLNPAPKPSTEVRHDHKRKFDALSEGEQESHGSSTAVNVVHPSEIRISDKDPEDLDIELRAEPAVKVR